MLNDELNDGYVELSLEISNIRLCTHLEMSIISKTI